MKRILYTKDDGTVAIIVPAGDIEDCIKDVPQGKEYKIVNTEDVPSDRSFRNAWKHTDGVIEVDIPKAVEIQKDRLRAERKPLLVALDTEYMKALEVKDEKKMAEVVAEKQRLRDITSFKASTVEELKSLTCKKE